MDVWYSSATGGLHPLLLECMYTIIDFSLCATWHLFPFSPVQHSHKEENLPSIHDIDMHS